MFAEALTDMISNILSELQYGMLEVSQDSPTEQTFPISNVYALSIKTKYTMYKLGRYLRLTDTYIE